MGLVINVAGKYFRHVLDRNLCLEKQSLVLGADTSPGPLHAQLLETLQQQVLQQVAGAQTSANQQNSGPASTKQLSPTHFQTDGKFLANAPDALDNNHHIPIQEAPGCRVKPSIIAEAVDNHVSEPAETCADVEKQDLQHLRVSSGMQISEASQQDSEKTDGQKSQTDRDYQPGKQADDCVNSLNETPELVPVGTAKSPPDAECFVPTIIKTMLDSSTEPTAEDTVAARHEQLADSSNVQFQMVPSHVHVDKTQVNAPLTPSIQAQYKDPSADVLQFPGEESVLFDTHKRDSVARLFPDLSGWNSFDSMLDSSATMKTGSMSSSQHSHGERKVRKRQPRFSYIPIPTQANTSACLLC